MFDSVRQSVIRADVREARRTFHLYLQARSLGWTVNAKKMRALAKEHLAKARAVKYPKRREIKK